MDFIPLLLALAVIGLGWWSALGARARARTAARRACTRAQVLFIDELALKRVRPGRGDRGQPCLKRDYGFEFTVRGERRYAGEVAVHGQQVVFVHMEPHPFGPDAADGGYNHPRN